MRVRETIAVLMTVLGLAAVGSPFVYQRARLAGPPGVRTIVLTGVSRNGVWTTDQVTAANYWHTDYSPAQIAVEPGERIRLILRSADTTHRFYLPSLGIGPIMIVPGHNEEVTFTVPKEGVYRYYCTELCVGGLCHYYMRGAIEAGHPKVDPDSLQFVCVNHNVPPPPASAGRVEMGDYLFHTMGCVTCHGLDGHGGIEDFNYAKRTVPRLDTLAERMFLQSKGDVAAFTRWLDSGPDPDHGPAPRGVSNWPLVLAQYKAVTETIQNGSLPAKAKANLPQPPLFMPRWREHLDRGQIDSLIAYLVSEEKFQDAQGWGQ